MAKQHFYSRVPAKMSLFNRMDSYDTFAHSAGIPLDVMGRELAAVCENKPTANDAELIRNGLLPTVYCGFPLNNGQAAQSAITYLKSDYTGERSAYLVHSLVLSEDEQKAHLCNPDAAALEKSIFKTDFKGFDLTSFESRPITDYPEISVPVVPANPIAKIAELYDVGMVKRLIYAFISVVTGKTKSVFVSIPYEFKDFSNEALIFMNSVLQIFPYHMRRSLSFVTYAGDYTKFSSIKIKFMPEEYPMAPIAKGVTVKIGSKDFAGIKDDNVAANAMVIDFFYGLLTADNVRREFLNFYDFAIKNVPELEKTTIKNLTDLVFLFRALSGYFEEQTVIPNDDVMNEYVTVYDKNRNALSEEYRGRSLKCLSRYAANHMPIPKSVFSRVARIYPSEPIESKTVIMRIMLELIHTDLMRDKLFTFIKNNYSKENAQMRAQIMENLCRVYYGGFLQEHLIEFFDENFAEEPNEVRENIVERLLLTVRTPKIQASVFAFLNKYFETFSEVEKQKFYITFYDMLPDADALTRSFADITDAYISENEMPAVAENIIKALEADEHRHQPALCAALCTKCGFTESVIVKKVFGDWSGRKVFERFLATFSTKTATEIVETVCEIWQNAAKMPADAESKLYNSVVNSFAAAQKSDLFSFIDSVNNINKLPETVKESEKFVKKLNDEVLVEAVNALLPTAFDYKRYPSGIADIKELSKNSAFLKKLDNFKYINAYIAMRNAVAKNGGAEIFENAAKIEGKPLRIGAAWHLAHDVKTDEISNETTYFFVQLTLEFFKSDAFAFADAANALREYIMGNLRAENPNGNAEQLALSADELTLKTALNAASLLLSSKINSDIKAQIVKPDSTVAKYVTFYINKREKAGKKIVLSLVDELPENEFRDLIKSTADAKTSSGGFFKNLFKK